MEKKYQRFQIDVVIVRDNPSQMRSNCNSIEFLNDGQSTAYVNEKQINPGASWLPSINNFGELDITQYNVRFDNSTGTENSLVVVRKSYC